MENNPAYTATGLLAVPLLSNEPERLAALRSYHILDTAEESDFDELTELASAICQTPIALISLVDRDRQWFKSHKGLSVTETPKEYSFCAHAIASPDPVMIVGDAAKDRRFAGNPLVTGDPHIAFYAGVPLVDKDGFGLGSLCVIDSKVRELSTEQLNALMVVARQVVNKLELRRNLMELKTANEKLGAANTELRFSENRFRNLIMQSPVAIAILTGRDMVIETANDLVIKIWGKDETVIGKPLQIALPELEGQPFLGILDEVFTSGMPYFGLEARVALEYDGVITNKFVNFVYQPIKGADGATKDIMVVANDLTEQVEARKTVEDANQRLEIALDAGELGSYDVDLVSGLMQCTNQFKKNYGLPADAIFNYHDLFESILPYHREMVRENVAAAIFHHTLFHAEYEVRWPDGSLHWISAHGQPHYDDQGNAKRVVGVTSNITEQVNARKKLEAAEEKFRLIADNISQLAWMADGKGDIFWYNKRWYDYTGTTPEDMQDWGWQKVQHPDHVERVKQKYIVHLQSGEVWEDTFPLLSAGGEFRWFLSRAIPTRNEQQEIILWFGTNTDITEQRRLEEQKDEFISIASHELKTPVTSLRASLQLLERIKDKPFSPIHIKLIEQSSRSMEKLTVMVDDLLNVNRLTEGQIHLDKTTFNINKMLNNSCNHVRLGGKYELIVDGDEELVVYADEHRIEQVIVNFVNNAIKYAPESSEIFLRVENLGHSAKISVGDTGPGIPAEKLTHLFDRYYRVDHSGKAYTGLGLGLYISTEIVKKHEGEIGVDSEMGKGSTFWFTLPLATTQVP